MQPPDWQTRWTGLFHLWEEADHYAKTTGRNQKVYNYVSSADRVAHIDGQLITIIVSNTRASSGV